MSLIMSGYVFTGPVSLNEYKYEEENGIFGIFYLKNPEKRVANYGISYVASLDEIKELKGELSSHRKYECWKANAMSSSDNIYIGLCLTPGMIPEKQKLIIRRLIYKYNPMCNK
ncbi:MAG: hypothetical protein ACLFP1_07815 [Candidatus Goldiibacteriota bacterium]